ncbi:MAG: peptide chain release factor N(5)-glutamine methyltransferase [Sphaerochaetaceae bacterium]|jgi:release factor glutamine methyltransferase
MKIKEALREATTRLSTSLVGDTPSLDALLLLMHTTSLTKEKIYINYEEHLSEKEITEYEKLITQREQHTPLAHLLKHKDFYNHTFIVNEKTLIPRGDSEIAVDYALSLLDENYPYKVLDLGTGSGILGISIAALRPLVDLTLSDISFEALAVASQNSRIILDKEVKTVQSSLFEALQKRAFHLIISNPPYLTQKWIADSSAEVQKEPHLALFGGGEDGLDLIRTIIDQSPFHLKEGGHLIVECDYRQIDDVKTLFEKRGFKQVESQKDLGHKERIVAGKWI